MPVASAAITLTVLALALVAFLIGTRPRRHREEPLHKQIRAWPEVTFRAGVELKANILGAMLSAKGP